MEAGITYDPSSPESPLHFAWQPGYTDALSAPEQVHSAPSPYEDDARAAYGAGVAAGLAEAGRRAAATPIAPTGAPPQEVPATFEVGGLPAFRYNLPNIPINRATVPTPGGVLEVEFFLRGSVTVTFPNAPPGISTDINNQGWRVEAIKALGPINAGIRVSGLGTDSPNIGAVIGTEFSNAEVRFTPPNTMSFIGQAKFDYSVPSRGFGDVAVKGQAGFELKVTYTPAAPPPVPTRDRESWLQAHGAELAAVGLVVLVVVVAVAAAPETGGGSLVLLGAI